MQTLFDVCVWFPVISVYVLWSVNTYEVTRHTWGYSLQPSPSSCGVWTPSNLPGSLHFACTEQHLDLWNQKIQALQFSFWVYFSLCVHLSSYEAHLVGGSLGPPASYTESRSNSEGWFACNGPAQARPAGSSLECLYHCFQRTARRDRKVSQGKMREILCMVPENWHQFRWTHPISVAIMDGSPFSGVIAESQEVGSHIVTPERRQHVVSMWVSIFFNAAVSGLCLTHWGSPVLVLRLLWTPSPGEHPTQTSGSCPLNSHTTLHPSCHLHHLSPGNHKGHNTCCCMSLLTLWGSQMKT